MATKISLITKDNVILKKKKDTLVRRFGLIKNLTEDFPELELNFTLTLEEWNLIWSFTSFLDVPTTKLEWIGLIKAADYLLLNALYSKILHKSALKYLYQERVIYDFNPITLEDIGKKIANPEYLTASEQQCQHMFWNGEATAPRCPNKVKPGYRLCQRCLEKY